MEFDRVKEVLDRLQVRFCQDFEWRGEIPDRQAFPVEVITSVTLPFTSDEWCSICMADGDHNIGGCCGTSSAAQSEVNQAFHQGLIKARGLERLAGLLASHDRSSREVYHFDQLDKPLEEVVEDLFGEGPLGWGQLTPWSKLAVIYHLTREYLESSPPRGLGDHMSPLAKAISILGSGFDSLSWERLYRSATDTPMTSQGEASRLLTLYRMLPALATFNQEVGTLDLPPFEGFALYDKQLDYVASNGYGLCIYKTFEEAEKILAFFEKQESQYTERVPKRTPVREILDIRPVRVSSAHGLEYL